MASDSRQQFDISDPVPDAAPGSSPTIAELWYHAALADDRLCRAFARCFDARLPRTFRSQRVAWEQRGQTGYGLLLPDSLPSADPPREEWYIYNVWGESLIRLTRRERERTQMLVLAESADDWAALLRQALRDQAADVRYQVTSLYIDSLGEVQFTPTSYRFELVACPPPQATGCDPIRIGGTGSTPEGAARAACQRWLDQQAQ